MKPKWLEWAQRIQSIAQAGIEYSKDVYDVERFEMLREISVEIVASHIEAKPEVVRSLFADETGYQTPKLDVRAVVPNGQTLLFVQEASNGRWSLPGGWAEINHTLFENVKKEVIEEAGLIVEPKSIVAILDRSRHVDKPYPYTVYKCFVLCERGPGEFRKNSETLSSGFYGRGEIPPLSVGRNTNSMIEMCFDFIEGRIDEIIVD